MEQGIKFNITSDTRGLERGAKRTKKELNDLSNTTQKSTKSNKNASAAAVEFGRVLGDLPYGIQGVANNIQQLTYVIGGGAGLQIAMAAVTSLMVVMSRNGSNLSDILGTLSGTTDHLAKAKERLANASKEEVAETRGEIEVLRSLLMVAQDETEAKQTRLRAIAKINDEYGDYLPNLNLENVNTEKVTKAVDKLSQSLIRQAKIRGAQNLISEQTEKILEAQSKSLIDQANAVDFLNAGLGAVTNTGNAAMTLIAGGAENAGEQISNANKQIEILRGLLQNLVKEDLDLGGVFSSVKGGKTALPTFAPTVGPNPFANFIQPDLLSGQAKIAFTNLSKVLKEDGPTLIGPGLSAIEQRMADFKERLASQTLDLAGAISSGFASIGTALAQGSNLFSAVGAAILQTMGSIATQLGQAAIAAGIAGIALKNLFANPAAAIAAGGVLVALGSALKAATNSVSGIGAGGGSGAGSPAGQGSFQGANVSSGSFQQGFGGRVVFEIGGRKLIGVLNNTLSAGERLGGNVSLR